jgi:hypothetical protein
MQPNNSTGYFSTPDEHYWNTQDAPRAEIVIVETEPPADAFPNKGRFKKGFDPRRHRFTRAECSKGFWAAVESIVSRYPDAIMPDGRHMVCNFLKSRTLAQSEVF